MVRTHAGYLGSLVLELLLRVGHIRKAYLLLRPKNGVHQQQRLEDLLKSPVFCLHHSAHSLKQVTQMCRLDQSVDTAVPGWTRVLGSTLRDVTVAHMCSSSQRCNILRTSMQCAHHVQCQGTTAVWSVACHRWPTIQDAPVAESTHWGITAAQACATACKAVLCMCSAMAPAVLGVPLKSQLTRASLSQALQRLEVVPGDISQPDCGVQHETQERLLPEVDFVLHAAASIQFTNHVHEDLRLSYLATESILKLSQRVSAVSHVCLLNEPHSFLQLPCFCKGWIWLQKPSQAI